MITKQKLTTSLISNVSRRKSKRRSFGTHRFEVLEQRCLLSASPNWSTAFPVSPNLSSDTEVGHRIITVADSLDRAIIVNGRDVSRYSTDGTSKTDWPNLLAATPMTVMANSQGGFYSVAMHRSSLDAPLVTSLSKVVTNESGQLSVSWTIDVPRLSDDYNGILPMTIYEAGDGVTDIYLAHDLPTYNIVYKFRDEGSGPAVPEWERPIQDPEDIGDVLIQAFATGPDGSLYVSGVFGVMVGSEDASIGGTLMKTAGSTDLFVAKLTDENRGDAEPAEVTWARRVGGGPSNESGYSLAVDDNTGDIFMAGTFTCSATFGSATFSEDICAGYIHEGYVVKMRVGGEIEWARHLASRHTPSTKPNWVLDYGEVVIGRPGLALSGNNVNVTGWFDGTADLDPGLGEFVFSSPGAKDNFILALGVKDGEFQAAWHIDPSTSTEWPVNAIAADGRGGVYAVGEFVGDAELITQRVASTENSNRYLVNVHPDNPVVSATGPSRIVAGTDAVFSATALDFLPQLDDLAAAITWTLDDTPTPVGSGSQLNLSQLPVGNHRLVAEVQDADQNRGYFTVALTVVPAAPTNLSGTVLGTSVKLTWTDTANSESGFEIWRVAKPKGNATPDWGTVTPLAVVAPNVTTYTDQNVSGSFYYRVRAYTLVNGEKIYSDFSNEILVSVGGGGKKK